MKIQRIQKMRTIRVWNELPVYQMPQTYNQIIAIQKEFRVVEKQYGAIPRIRTLCKLWAFHPVATKNSTRAIRILRDLLSVHLGVK